jgi:hypothetical protein
MLDYDRLSRLFDREGVNGQTESEMRRQREWVADVGTAKLQEDGGRDHVIHQKGVPDVCTVCLKSTSGRRFRWQGNVRRGSLALASGSLLCNDTCGLAVCT